MNSLPPKKTFQDKAGKSMLAGIWLGSGALTPGMTSPVGPGTTSFPGLPYLSRGFSRAGFPSYWGFQNSVWLLQTKILPKAIECFHLWECASNKGGFRI